MQPWLLGMLIIEGGCIVWAAFNLLALFVEAGRSINLGRFWLSVLTAGTGSSLFAVSALILLPATVYAYRSYSRLLEQPLLAHYRRMPLLILALLLSMLVASCAGTLVDFRLACVPS